MAQESGQRHNIGEKNAVILYTYIVAMRTYTRTEAKLHAAQKFNNSVMLTFVWYRII